MILLRNNYAFIDSQNFHLGVKKLGWQLDYQKFRIYLHEKYGAEKAYLFIGFIESNRGLYDNLARWEFDIVFKPVVTTIDGKIKGNVDADLVLKAVTEVDKYNKAVIVSSDGDFYSLVNYLSERGKLEVVITSEMESCSRLLQEAAGKNIRFINEMQKKLEYKEYKKEPPKDGTLSGAFDDNNNISISKDLPPSNSF
jgi:uncharacterized LabA/DUF88 family protein